MLFTLATLKKIGEWHLVQHRIKCWSKNAFFRARMLFSQSLLVTDGTFKSDFAMRRSCSSSRRKFTYYLSTVVVCHTQLAPVVYISARLWLSAHKTC